jgi:hypothetical protein
MSQCIGKPDADAGQISPATNADFAVKGTDEKSPPGISGAGVEKEVSRAILPNLRWSQ